MAKLIQPPHRFTHPEWVTSNKIKYRDAETERQIAERLVEESKRIICETKERTDYSDNTVNFKMDARIKEVEYWKGEVERHLEITTEEIDCLSCFDKRLEKAIESCAEPLHITQQNLVNREKRFGIDLVHEDVQKELLKEAMVTQGVLELLQRTLEQVREQNRLNRKVKYALEKDIKDKFMACEIDTHSRELHAGSFGVAALHDKCLNSRVVENQTSVKDWEQETEEIVKKAQREKSNSCNLRSVVTGILEQTYCDALRQKDFTDAAFKKRVEETKVAKAKLEDHLCKILNQIRDMEENMDQLERAICEKEQPLGLAKTRLGQRQQRPGIQNCSDQAQYKILDQVKMLEWSIDTLEKMREQTRQSLKGLRRQQLELEEDITIKSTSVFVDEVENMGMRESINLCPW